jgi:hypothetical protein
VIPNDLFLELVGEAVAAVQSLDAFLDKLAKDLQSRLKKLIVASSIGLFR